jgi:branched-subunit amino acid ABC-type transport system permease component
MLQILTNSAFISGIYILISLPFLLYSKYFGWINFGIGGLFLVSGLVFWYFENLLNLNIFAALFLSFIVTSVVTLAIHWFLKLLDTRGQSLNILIISLIILDVLQNAILISFSFNTKIFNLPNIQFHIHAINFSLINITTFIVSFLAMGLIFYFFEISNISLRFKALGSSLNILSTNKNNPFLVQLLVVITLAICIWMGGIVVAVEYNVSFNLIALGIKGWILSMLAKNNLYSLPIVCIAVSFLEGILILFSPAGFKDASLFFVMILFLVFSKSTFFYGKLSR